MLQSMSFSSLGDIVERLERIAVRVGTLTRDALLSCLSSQSHARHFHVKWHFFWECTSRGDVNDENDDEDVSIDEDARAHEARVQQMLATAAKGPVCQFDVADAHVQMPMVEDEKGGICGRGGRGRCR